MLYSSLARLLDNIVNRQDLQEIDSNFLYTNKKNGSYQNHSFFKLFQAERSLMLQHH